MLRSKLTEVLPHMKGELVQGTVDEIIKHVTVDARDIRKNTLYFARSSKATKWKSFPFKDSVVIVTENPYPILCWYDDRRFNTSRAVLGLPD